MGRFFDEKPELAKAYNLRDAEITALYIQRFNKFCIEKLGLKRPRTTLGGVAVAIFLKEIAAQNLERERLLGLTTRKRIFYSRQSKRYITSTEELHTFGRALVEKVASLAYQGGRTETFMTGPIRAQEFSDIDLRSAYPTALAAIGVPDYAAVYTVGPGDIALFTADVLGFADVEFSAPETLRFPVFAVPSDRGPIFPRRGQTVATAAEIAAAVHLGCEVRIRTGVILPCDHSVRPFEKFIVQMLGLRTALKDSNGKDTLESKTVKTMSNALYGKTAQSVKPSTAYDPQLGFNRPIGPSAITCAPFAAYTPGLVRAVIAELMNSIPTDDRRVVVSVSTDGFLTSAALNDLSMDGPATQVLLAARRRIDGATGDSFVDDRATLLEVKKRAREVVAFRNRGIATTAPAVGSEPIVAKAGVKVERGVDANDYMLELYLNRTHETVLERCDLISLGEQLRLNADLVSVVRSLRINLEPDFKRDIIAAEDAEIGHGRFAGARHLATVSQPFETVEEAVAARAAFDGWRYGRQRVLKTLQDWEDWRVYQVSRRERRRGSRGKAQKGQASNLRGGPVGVFKRHLLRALVSESWGLSMRGMTQRHAVERLNACGFEVKISDLKKRQEEVWTSI